MKKKIMIGIIIVVLCAGGYFTVQYFLNKDLENQRQELQEITDQYGTVEKESVSTIIHKFNVELNNVEDLNYAYDEYAAVQDGLYWYRLYEDIYCYLKPIEFTNNKNTDIVDIATIHYFKKSKDEQIALEYVKYLMKANNSELTDAEVETLMDDAKKLSSKGKKANNGKGISIGLLETEEVVEYQITRLYHSSK